MATPTLSDPSSRNTQKMIVQQPELINIADLKPTDFNKIIEAKLYRKWIARNPKHPDSKGLCCTLIDRTVSKPAILGTTVTSYRIENHSHCLPTIV